MTNEPDAARKGHEGPPAGAAGSAPRLALIDGLRGVAILGVVYHHTLKFVTAPSWTPSDAVVHDFAGFGWSPYTLLWNTWLGVNLFFVLSGFVLALPYALERRQMRSWHDARGFFTHRAARLLPLYYVCLALGLFMGPPPDYGSRAFLEEVAGLCTFTFIFQEGRFFPAFNIPLWSLAVEVWFSALFPLLIAAQRRFGTSRVLAVSLAFSLGVRIWAAATHEGVLQPLDPFRDGVAGRLDDFVIGMALAQTFASGRRLSRRGSVAALAASPFLFLVCTLAWDNVLLARLSYLATPWLNTLAQASFALLMLGLLGDPPRFVRAALTTPPLQLAGRLCYSLYLWHMMGSKGPDYLVDLPFYLLFALLLSCLTYRFVEFPNKSFRELFLSYPR
jgi:peptidoglycan/LPS O-acetylase OafA/YrhL